MEEKVDGRETDGEGVRERRGGAWEEIREAIRGQVLCFPAAVVGGLDWLSASRV